MRRRIRQEDGAAAVEFALIVGLLSILVFGLLEYGIAFWQVQNLRAAVREGARVAAVRGDAAAIEAAMVDSSAGSLTGGETFTVTTNGVPGQLCGPDGTERTEVRVELVNSTLSPSVQAAFQVSIPFLPPIQLDPTLSGSFRCE
ncbi:MAG TPA: TadE/TadG family type IV pilus assembly protein [Actinomycetota bacterium]|nr:TadE/TadG family type IV pilus assembly protein [Actinomycetota bacterium]